MRLDTAIYLAALGLVLLWPIHQQLMIRALRRALHQLHQRQRQHAGAIIQLQTTVANTPLQVHQPMPKVGRGGDAGRDLFAPGGPSLARDLFAPSRTIRANLTNVDDTLRLGPPPSLTRIDDACKAAGLMTVPREALARIAAIEQHLAGGRTATRMELARALNVQPWEVAADLHTAVLAKIVTTTSAHTAGEATYVLADPTVRMGRMSVLPGVGR